MCNGNGDGDGDNNRGGGGGGIGIGNGILLDVFLLSIMTISSECPYEVYYET